ncbi:metal ABC transporter substrate-binding protein [Paenibacillus sp. MMS20-IR301]|uniref:metal ABC transporter substrate-binding protein n=1 Tax=Paenibacillus sp. MMS20-IR301 TaxID=2895946 RepID=UPI0028EAD7C6|nr:metal ABC transporter substrate-binding protein [Paenibacillus sp. MMS20-IR301]WNS46920.1 metal ABC transporter substrate-binding protein [Paenibacillus sp. MMS20-IR301]
MPKSGSRSATSFLRLRHFAAVPLAALLIIAGCGSNNSSTGNSGAAAESGSQTTAPTAAATSSAAPAAERLSIKTSFYPMYEFTKNITGGLADVQLLIPAGIEPHDWEPTAKDMADISAADVLVYNGAGMEGWAQQVVDGAAGSQLLIVEASKDMEIMAGSEEEHGHEHEAEHEDEHEHDHDHEHEGEHEHEHEHEGEAGHEGHDHGGLDPHVWLDPAMAIQEVRTIEAALSAAAPEHAAAFKTNSEAYIAKLQQLDQEFKDGLKDSKRKDFITQHAAFGYLARQYGLTQVPIAGLSPEQEPSAAQMADIVEFAKANNVKTIFFETLVSSSVADTIAREIGAKSAVLNPLEGLTEEDIQNNLDYIGIMRQNLAALIAALNE